MGLAMMRGALTTFRALATGVDISETAERVAEAVATAGSVLVVVSVVLDGILLILAAIQGAKQRTALQEYGNFLFKFIPQLSDLDSVALAVLS